MRKFFLLFGSFGSGLLVLSLLIFINTAAVKPSASSAQTAREPQTEVQSVEYIQPANITFPCTIPGTDLTAEGIVLYEGGYLEDGSNEEVVNIAGLQVCNRGDKILESVKVVLKRGNTGFTFTGSFIPRDCPVLLLEADRKLCPFQNFTYCSGEQCAAHTQWLSEDELKIQTISMGSVCVTNTSDRTLQNIRLYYKNFLPESQLYVGGITRKKKIPELCPGESVTIFPQCFAKGYSRILGAAAKKFPEKP